MSAPRALVLAMPPDLVDPRLQFRKPGFKRAEIAGEGAFGPDGFPDVDPPCRHLGLRQQGVAGHRPGVAELEPNVPMISGQ